MVTFGVQAGPDARDAVQELVRNHEEGFFSSVGFEFRARQHSGLWVFTFAPRFPQVYAATPVIWVLAYLVPAHWAATVLTVIGAFALLSGVYWWWGLYAYLVKKHFRKRGVVYYGTVRGEKLLRWILYGTARSV